MEESLKQIAWYLNVIATEFKRYNDAQNYPPSKLTENIERKKQKAAEEQSSIEPKSQSKLAEFLKTLDYK